MGVTWWRRLVAWLGWSDLPRQAPAVAVAPGDCRLVSVGVNLYVDSPENALRGCVNDARFVRRDEVARGWSPVGALLLDYAATRRATLELVGNAAADLRRGQILLVQWSSHGVLAADQREPDGVVEALCPTDALVDWPRNLVTAFDLAALFRGVVEGAHVILLADACHSGIDADDAERLRTLRRLGNPYSYRVPRALILPPDLRPARGARRTLAGTRPGAVTTPWKRWVLISGCRSDQTSADALIGGEYQGAMTHAYRAGRAVRGATLLELHAEMIDRLAAGGFEQEPQLEGAGTHMRIVLP